MIQSTGARILTLLFSTVWLTLPGFAQDRGLASADAQSESHVSAEMVKGRLNPETSKPGDEIAVRLNEDVKSNGQVLLKKGATIKGVVRKVNRAEKKRAAKANGTARTSAQSMLELEWITPGVSGAASQQLNLALQSVVYTNPLYAHEQEQASTAPAFASPAPAPARSGSADLELESLAELLVGQRHRCPRSAADSAHRARGPLELSPKARHTWRGRRQPTPSPRRPQRYCRTTSALREVRSSSSGAARPFRARAQRVPSISSRACLTTQSSRRRVETSRYLPARRCNSLFAPTALNRRSSTHP